MLLAFGLSSIDCLYPLFRWPEKTMCVGGGGGGGLGVGVWVGVERERETETERQRGTEIERGQRGGVLSVRRPELPGAGKDTKLLLLKHPDAQHSMLAIGTCRENSQLCLPPPPPKKKNVHILKKTKSKARG